MFKQLKEVLGNLLMAHKEIIEYYNKLKERAENEQVKLLLTRMIENKEKLYNIIELYQHEDKQPDMDEWIQFMPQKSVKEEFSNFTLDNDMSIDEVTKVAVYFDNWLENILKHLEEKAISKEAKGVFIGIIDMMSHDKMELSTNQALMKDLEDTGKHLGKKQ
jgi:hypothetical protein